MDKDNVFQIKTKRRYGKETPPYGEAQLIFPDGGRTNISAVVERKNGADDTWEQRVIAYAVNFLREDGYNSFSIADASEPPGTFSNKIWMILASH